MITEVLKKIIAEALAGLGVEHPRVVLEHPVEISHGDYATNVALAHAKELKRSPMDLAKAIKEYVENVKPEQVEKIEIAGPGFINFYLSKQFFVDSLKQIMREDGNFGKNTIGAGKKVLDQK